MVSGKVALKHYKIFSHQEAIISTVLTKEGMWAIILGTFSTTRVKQEKVSASLLIKKNRLTGTYIPLSFLSIKEATGIQCRS